MTTTIDKAGRVVIPLALRRQFHFEADSEIEILPDERGVFIRLPRREARFVDKEGVLVQAADQTTAFDATAFINSLREARSLETVLPKG